MIITLLLTVVIESAVVITYTFCHKQPAAKLLLNCFIANLTTQSMLWLMLSLFPDHYLETLLATEAHIWLIEGIMLKLLSDNQLSWQEAVSLSFGMNLTSFGVGWFLPV
ncbi:MAG: hypothetical protein JXB07_03535 [Anaerolineae bacterium]|nr:hypothetical protein [Anaerolineae bacterium]